MLFLADPTAAADVCLADVVLEHLLSEDAPYGDLTTRTLGIGDCPGRIILTARGALVTCGLEEAARMFRLRGATVVAVQRSGLAVPAGTALLEAEGSAGALHLVWKVAQTLVEALSGIATATRAIVAAARAVNPTIQVACTRKNFPGAKALAIKAICAGGAVPHRLGLSESVLFFPEHRVFLPDEPLSAARIRSLKIACPEKKIVAEATTFAEALALAEAGVDVLQVEKFSPDAVREVVRAVGDAGWPVLVAAAGGVNAGNAAAYAAAGAGLLVTSAPYFAPPTDVKVTLVPRTDDGAKGPS